MQRLEGSRVPDHPTALFLCVECRMTGDSPVPTDISVANFQAACGECYDAIESEDRKSAYKWYAMAEAQNTGLEEAVSEAGASIRRRTALNGLKNALAAMFPVITQESEDSRFIQSKTRHGG